MSEGVRLRVVSYNIHAGRPAAGPTDLPAIAAVLRDLEPDLCGLQEVLHWPAPFRHRDQPGRLTRATGLHVRFRPSFGLGRLGFGNAILSGVRPLSVRRLWLPGRGEPRTVLHARFVRAGVQIHFLNTHLTLLGRDRLRQAAFLARYVRRLEGPVLLTGDLNTEPGGAELEILTGAGLRFCGPLDTLTFPAGAPTKRLDYVAVSGHWTPDPCRAVQTAASDHLPLVVDLALTAHHD